MTYRNLDESELSRADCTCPPGTYSEECPVDRHRVIWLQRQADWDADGFSGSEKSAPTQTSDEPAGDRIEISRYRTASLFGDDDYEGEELKMGKSHGFIDGKTMRDLVKKRVAGRKTTEIAAEELKVSRQYLYKVLSGVYDVGPAIAKAMGWEQFVGYRRMAPKRQPRPRAKPKAKAPAKAEK